MAVARRWRDGPVALGAALLATTLEALGRLAWSGPYLPELMAQKLFDSIPMWAFTPLLRTFGANAKMHAFGGMVALEIAGWTVLGGLLRTRMRRARSAGWSSIWLVAAAAGGVAAAVLFGVLPALGAGMGGHLLAGGPWMTVPTVAVVAGAYATVLARGLSA
jgi:hypothetical protein